MTSTTEVCSAWCLPFLHAFCGARVTHFFPVPLLPVLACWLSFTPSLVVFWRVYPYSSALWMIHREEIHAHGPSSRHEIVVLAHGMPKSKSTWQAAVGTDVHLQLQSSGLVLVTCYTGLWESCSAGMHIVIVLLTGTSAVELISKFLGPQSSACTHVKITCLTSIPARLLLISFCQQGSDLT